MMSTKTIKCPVDGRLFATAAALKQHTATKHGNSGPSPKPRGNPARATRAKNARVTMGSINSQNYVISGSDLIGTITLKDSMVVGAPLLVWEINPATLQNTRLARMSQVFSRWRPRKLSVIVVPGAGVLTPGSYAIGWTADQHFDLGSAESRVQRLLTLKPNILGVFGTPRTLVIPCDTTQKWYMCDPSLGAESDHGLLIAVLAGKLGGNNISINFRLEWTMEFSSPDLPASIEDLEIYPDPDYIPIFTDSVSDWADGKRLTFKHKEGGSVVPWIGLREKVIYEPTKGVTIYYNDGTKDQECKFFAKITGSSLYTSALACFADEAAAKAYISSGDVTKVLEYKAASGYATPSLPTLKGKSVTEEPLLNLTHSAGKRLPNLAPGTPSFSMVKRNRNVTILNQIPPYPRAPTTSFSTPPDVESPWVNIGRPIREGNAIALSHTSSFEDLPGNEE
uniref:Uncharacterized protein n=2 Tax=Lygus hesperus TaxID=30085 RepID=A0A0K8SVQ8_LYGHE